MKNNEAAKRSRDMRIKREKVVFEENSRLEQENRDLRTEMVIFKAVCERASPFFFYSGPLNACFVQ
jgi:hypothetical protein